VALYFGTLAQTTDATGAVVRGFPAMKVNHHPAVQPDRHRRQLRRGVVRDPVNTFANSRTAFASLTGKPYPNHAIP